MPTSSFIDFSDKIYGTRSIFELNKKDQNCSMIAARMGFTSEMLAVPEQIHSSSITFVDKPGYYSASDGLITDNPNIILTLKVADCVPIYISSSKIIGLIHSGWRGTADGIVSNGVRKMLQMGENKKDIRVFLGPAIGVCCYEVDKEVAVHFNKKAKIKIKDGKWKVGLHEEICLQLTNLGIPSTNIKTSDICTFESKNYHSYRRDGEKTGRMFAFMGLRK